jgi:tetratricopeptide (TPR) repeat protein
MNRWPRIAVAASVLSLCFSLHAGFASSPPEFDRAARLAMAGDYEGASKEYRSFLDRAPNDRLSPVAAMAVANIYLDSSKDSAGAVPWLDRVVKNYPTSQWAPEAARAMGRCEESQKKWREAGETYMLALDLASKNKGAFSDRWMNEVTFSAANSFFTAGDRPKQIAAYRKVLDGDPPPEVAATSLFRIAESFEQDGDAKTAAENYARIVREHPGSPLFDAAVRKRPLIEKHETLDWASCEKYAEGTALVQRQDFAGALRNTDELLAGEIAPALRECLDYRKITLETAQAGDYSDGCRRLREYIDQHPTGQRTALARRTLEQNWGPIAEMETVTQEHPDDAEAWGNLGMACVQARAGTKAVAALEKAVALAPQDAQMYLGLGYAYSLVRRNDEAAKAFEFYLQQNPNDENALNLIGYSYLGLGQADKAIPYFERYARLAPEDANSHDSLGEGYLTAGRLEDAAREYERALELNPTFSNSQFMLAGVYQQMGNTEKAITAYRRFLDLSPGGPQADEARNALQDLANPRPAGKE